MTDVQDRGRNLFFAIFTISGFSGLIYESIWSHYLKLFLGHAAYAQTLVLAIFMGGMALGSWIISRKSARVMNLLIGYAIVEGVIGLLGLTFHKTSIFVTSWAFDVLLPNLGSPLLVQLSKWTLGAVLILPQSILLGMTFPLMSGAIVRRYPQRAGETLAMLYFTNSLGAAIGVLVSGFYLIGAVGLPGTIMTAALLNVALALTVWGIVKYQPDSVQPPSQSAITPDKQDGRGVLRWMLVGAAITGAAAFLYEIAWVRMLSLVLGSSTHSFELMLSAFILGIALGGLWVRRRIDSLTQPVKFLGWVMLIMALVALASLPIYNTTFDVMAYAIATFTATDQGYLGFNLASHAIAMLLMIPTTFFCGMTLPIMTSTLIRAGAGERAIGAVYAWNTAGAIVGVIVAVHVLMPVVGIKGIVITGALLHATLGALYLSRHSASRSGFRLAGLPTAIGAVAVVATALLVDLDPRKLSSGVYRHGRARQEVDNKVLFLEHGKTASVSLVDVGGLISIATNGKPDASIMMRGDKSAPDESTMVLAGALPFALHGHPARVANIGIGSGLTTHVLLANEAVRLVDTVEIEPLMAKAAEIGFMPRVERTFRDPRSHIYIEDAKTFFAKHRSKYDVIISEPSNPWVSGVSTLFSEEFYRHIVNYLEPDGMLIQWIQAYETNLTVVMSVIKALAPQFDDFAIYNADDSNLLIVAVKTGRLPKPDARLFASPGVRSELARVGVESVRDIDGRYLGNKELLLPLVRSFGVPANSDYFPFVDLNAARARFLRSDAGEYPGLLTLPVPLFDLLDATRHTNGRTSASLHGMSYLDLVTNAATKLRDALETSRYDALPPESARIVLALQSPKDRCAQAAVQRTWLDSAYYVAANTNLALNPGELEPIWRGIKSTPCAIALAHSDAQMLSLLSAIAARDTAAVASVGGAMFSANYKFDKPEEMYTALLATAAGKIAVKKPSDALALIREHAVDAQPGPSLALALRWLSAIASQPAAAGGAQTR
jgi:spermidine synthase